MEELEAENKDLRDQVKNLEAEIEEMKEVITKMGELGYEISRMS